jgi:transketolase
MVAILNGMALHGGFIPYGGTFLTFSDYARNALRMAALMKIQNILVFTHDSIGLGEDGPTHQPVEHVASLQLVPNMRVWRPCDAVETGAAWRDALERRDGPSSLILTRQSLPAQTRTDVQMGEIRSGGYVLRPADNPDLILIATGSEVALAMVAAEQLDAKGYSARVVSMPCASLFLEQNEDYREAVLPGAVVRRIAIEAGSTHLWYRFVGPSGRVIGLDRFGASAPAEELFELFGFTPAAVMEAAMQLMEKE